MKTEACGVCHTDLHAARGDWPLKPTPPFIPGHEGIGWSKGLPSHAHRYVVCTGGGIMEAANRGAADAGGGTIGHN